MKRFWFVSGCALVSTVLGVSTSRGQELAAPPTRPSGNTESGPARPNRPTFQQTVTLERRNSRFQGLEALYGFSMANVDEGLRSQLEIPAHQGLVVTVVKSGSLADQAGLKTKDVLLKFNDQPLTSVDQAAHTFLSLGKNSIQVSLIREGKPRELSLVGPKHSTPAPTSEYWIGVPVSPVDSTLRSHLADLPADRGLIATEVVKESPAEAAGVKKFDVLLSMSGKPLQSLNGLLELVQASGGKAVPLTLLRVGKPMTLEITPTQKPTTGTYAESTNTFYKTWVTQPVVGVEVFNPARAATLRSANGSQKPINLQFDVSSATLNPDEASGRIETQLKDLNTKVEQIQKALEELKKTDRK